MARTETSVSEATFRASVEKAEVNGPLTNYSALFKAVADLYNESGITPAITPAIASARITKWNISLKTTAGKRGRGPMSPEQKTALMAGRAATPRVARAEKFAIDPQIQASFVVLRENTPENLHTLCNRIEKGSAKAAIKLMCCQCMGFDEMAKAIRNCTSKGCPLYAFRPYQKTEEIDAPSGETD